MASPLDPQAATPKADPKALLDYLDKEGTLMGLLMAFCVAATGLLFERLAGATTPKGTTPSDLVSVWSHGKGYVFAAAASLMFAALMFYRQHRYFSYGYTVFWRLTSLAVNRWTRRFENVDRWMLSGGNTRSDGVPRSLAWDISLSLSALSVGRSSPGPPFNHRWSGLVSSLPHSALHGCGVIFNAAIRVMRAVSAAKIGKATPRSGGSPVNLETAREIGTSQSRGRRAARPRPHEGVRRRSPVRPALVTASRERPSST